MLQILCTWAADSGTIGFFECRIISRQVSCRKKLKHLKDFLFHRRTSCTTELYNKQLHYLYVKWVSAMTNKAWYTSICYIVTNLNT